MSAAFKLLKDEALKLNEVNFTPFVKYMEEQWLEREGPKSISVYLELERTNNPMESYNSTLGSKISTKGCFYKFVELLRAEEFIKSRDYAIISNGGTQLYHKQKKCYREKNEAILSIQQQFENGKVTLEEFFEKAADLYEEDLDDNDDEEDDEDVSSEENVLEKTDENCENCHLNMRDTMFLPCLHLKFCGKCVDSLLVNSDPQCPVCNGNISERLQVFLWYYFQH